MLQVLWDTHGPDGAARPHEFDTGMDAVPEAVDMAVRLMTPGELSLVRSSGRFAYDRRADRPEVGLAVPSIAGMASQYWQGRASMTCLPSLASLALHHSAAYTCNLQLVMLACCMRHVHIMQASCSHVRRAPAAEQAAAPGPGGGRCGGV